MKRDNLKLKDKLSKAQRDLEREKMRQASAVPRAPVGSASEREITLQQEITMYSVRYFIILLVSLPNRHIGYVKMLYMSK